MKKVVFVVVALLFTMGACKPLDDQELMEKFPTENTVDVDLTLETAVVPETEEESKDKTKDKIGDDVGTSDILDKPGTPYLVPVNGD